MLIIGGVVASFAVFNSVYPAVERSSQAVSSAADVVNDRMTSRIEIIQVSGSGSTIDAWVKNVGSARIGGIEGSDIFFGTDGSASRVLFGDNTSSPPYWSYHLEGENSQWTQAVTNRITIYLADPPAPGIHRLKMVIPNGIFDESVFSLE
jgi:flagellar protein FlaG